MGSEGRRGPCLQRKTGAWKPFTVLQDNHVGFPTLLLHPTCLVFHHRAKFRQRLLGALFLPLTLSLGWSSSGPLAVLAGQSASAILSECRDALNNKSQTPLFTQTEAC